jgi:putative ATP-dependent endonuclease of the OLD family
MPRLKSISIENFRSIGGNPVEINFPENTPVILIGENNAGKSNIIRAIELMFGEFHPKYKKLDDYDHFERNPLNKILIKTEVRGFENRLGRSQEFTCGGFNFSCVKNSENGFEAIQLENGSPNHFVSSLLREELLCVVVNSEQNLSYQLSYATKYTLLSKVTKAFHDKLVEDPNKVSELKALFEATKEVFLSVPEFHGFTEKMSDIAGQMLSNMSHALQFDFSAYDPSNYFRTLRVQPSEDDQIRAIEELGTGQQQILALAFAHAYARSFLGQGLLFIIDEPEAHLHPLAQKWLANQMFKMANDGLQLVITTHSPFFIDLEYLKGIYLVKKEGQTHVNSITAVSLARHCQRTGATRANEDTIIPFYSAHSTPQLLSGFFANKIVLVEGPTEEIALPIYLDAVGLDTLKNGIAVIGVGGKGNLAKWWRLFTAYQIPTFICFDNDAGDDSAGTKRKDALKATGIPEADLAQLLTLEDWNINERFCVFGRNFERTMRNSFSSYTQIEAEENLRLGDSKPILAKNVAKKICAAIRTDDVAWEKYDLLKNRIIGI